MGLYKAQFISMIIMVSLGIAIFVGFNMEWYSIEVNTSDFFEATGYADYRIVSEKGFSADELDKILHMSGVENAARYLAATVDIKERSGDSVSLSVTGDENVSGFMLISGEKYDPESKDGIWISDKYAAANDISLGDNLTLTYKGIEFRGIVRGLIKSGEHMICVRDSSQLMPDFNTFGYAYISPVMYEAAIGFDYYPQINVISEAGKNEFVENVDKTLGNTPLVLTKDETISYSGAKGETEEGQTMGSIMPVLFLLIAVLTMVTTMHRLTAKEKTQIGTLKALGFKDRRILRHYTSYAFMIGVIGTVIGIVLGYGVAYYIMNPDGMMSTYMDLPEWKLCFPWFCFIVLGGILIMLTVIGFLSVWKMLRGTAADALSPYSPRKMKPMLIEKTSMFHKLSFGTRWNMRDIMRHKSRTAMSLIGTIGCTVIVVGSMGMRDTMNSFLSMYYDNALCYATRIYLSEEATAEQKNEVVEKYHGDTSGSVSVQIGDKTVSLDVYELKHSYVRFPGEDGENISLGDDGAYICVRIADECGLKAGDNFSVSPYGSDEEYTFRVAEIIRSVTESIVVSSDYAEKCSVKYAIDSVYTAVGRDEIEKETAIKSVQSKQMIIDSFDTFTEMMDAMIVLMVGGAILLGVVVLYNLGIMSYTERYREMATLKVVGFKDKKIGRLLIDQNMWLSLTGVVIGIPLGILTLDYLLKALAGEYEMSLTVSAVTYIISVMLTFGMSLLVSLMVARKNKKIDMVEALKGAE